jgi:cytochrome c oxidase assembly protein subunit 15
MKKKVVIILIGGLLQGVLGWFMVKSGLVNNPHVSHYRLAAHLMMALSLIVYIYWTALYYKHGIRKNVNSFISNKLINGLLLLVSMQIVYGAFVAGLKAGKMYNTFPKMGNNWFPKEIGQGFNEFGLYALTESHAVVQLIHRIIGISCFLIAVIILLKSKKYPRPISPSVRYLAMLVIFQVVLGVFTLVMAVPINLGVLHQSIAIVILLAIFNLKFKNRFSGKVN